MADKDAAQPVSAEALRMLMIEKQMKEVDEQMARRKIEEKKHAEFAEAFLKEHVTEAERALIRRLVMQAVEAGKFEAMVYSFPSTLCSDGGRAINNADPDWPSTLQGKAKELYQGFEKNIRPQGYKLSASIISFPGGMPGDVGFSISWAPEKF